MKAIIFILLAGFGQNCWAVINKNIDLKAAAENELAHIFQASKNGTRPSIAVGAVKAYGPKVKAARTTNFSIGYEAQLYRPQGFLNLRGYKPIHLGSLSKGALSTLDVRWGEPWRSGDFGTFIALGYLAQDISIEAEGQYIESSQLSLYELTTGPYYEYRNLKYKKYHLGAELGLGLLYIEHKSPLLASASANTIFASIGVYAKINLYRNVYIKLSYKNKVKFASKESVDVQNNNMYLGMTGEFK